MSSILIILHFQLFDPTPLLKGFEDQIEVLWNLLDDVSREVTQREDIVKKKQQAHQINMVELEDIMKSAYVSLEKLNIRIRDVSTKTVHIGDQLEAVNLRRCRALEAKSIMERFEDLNRRDYPLQVTPLFFF